jgi:hypothetical protein
MRMNRGDRITWSPVQVGPGPHGPRHDFFGTVVEVRESRFIDIGTEVVYEEDGRTGSRFVQAAVFVRPACAEPIGPSLCVLVPRHAGDHRPGSGVAAKRI